MKVVSTIRKNTTSDPRLADHLRTNPEKIVVPPYYPDTPEVRRLLTRHYDNIATMDAVVEKLLQELRRPESENTIVFFYSDHGTGLPRHKRWLFDTGVKVPLSFISPNNTKNFIPLNQEAYWMN